MARMEKATWQKVDGEWMIVCHRGETGDTVIVQRKGAGASYETLGEEVEPGVFRKAP